MSAAAEVAPGLERLTVPQPTADGHGTAMAPMQTRTALSLIFPCYNEAERLPQTLATYLAQLSGNPVRSRSWSWMTGRPMRPSLSPAPSRHGTIGFGSSAASPIMARALACAPACSRPRVS